MVLERGGGSDNTTKHSSSIAIPGLPTSQFLKQISRIVVEILNYIEMAANIYKV